MTYPATSDARTTLHLVCGLPGSGKSTLARQIESDTGAVRLTEDEWILALMSDPDSRDEMDAVRPRVEALQWQTAQDLLKTGVSVTLENGYWWVEQRKRYREGGQRLGARVVLHYLDVPLEELLRRVLQRNPTLASSALRISEAELSSWFEVFEVPAAEEMAGFDEVRVVSV